jgi:hypothetical protein
MKFYKLPTRLKHAWLYMAGFLMAGVAMLPALLTPAAIQALIAGVCFGVAAMIALFMLGKKPANEVE